MKAKSIKLPAHASLVSKHKMCMCNVQTLILMSISVKYQVIKWLFPSLHFLKP